MEVLNPISRDVWWLVVSEAVLFFSFAYWEPVSSYGRPLAEPLFFWVALIGVATVATLVCHVGPALFAAAASDWTTRWRWLVIVWLAGGLIEWWHTLTVPAWVWPIGKAGAIALFFFVGIAGAVLRLARTMLATTIALSVVILVWAFASTLEGWHLAARYQYAEPEALRWRFVAGLLTAATPVVVLAYRVGRIERRRSRILLTGLLGVWVPMVVAMGAAAISMEAGANLHWRPSLQLGSEWMLIGVSRVLGSATFVVMLVTLLGPAVVAVDCVRDLVMAGGSRRQQVALLAASSGVAWILQWAYRREGGGSLLLRPQHEDWAFIVWLLAVGAGAFALIKRELRRSEKGQA